MKTESHRPTPLFALAERLAPEAERDWLEAMRLELPFVPRRERWRWGVSALGLALRWRLAALAPSRVRVALVTASLVALVAALVALPNTRLPWRGPAEVPSPTAQQPAAPAAQSARASPPEVLTETPTEMRTEMPAKAQAESSLDARALAAEAESAPTGFYEVSGGSVTLVAQREIEVVLFEGEQLERRLRLAAGERLELTLSAPLTVRVQDAGALEALTPEGAFRLGKDGEALEATFTPAP